MYVNPSARNLLFTTFICLQTLFTFGQRKNFFINRTEPSWLVKLSPKDYKMNPREVSDGYYMGLVEKQNHVELNEEYRHFTREIVSQSGVQNGSEISVTYDPDFQKLTFHKIIVWSAICLAWAVYFRQSARVKRTFVFTYPELGWKVDRIKHSNALASRTLGREQESSAL